MQITAIGGFLVNTRKRERERERERGGGERGCEVKAQKVSGEKLALISFFFWKKKRIIGFLDGFSNFPTEINLRILVSWLTRE